MRKLLLAVATLSLAACSMYGAPPQRIHDPSPIKPPPVVVEAARPVIYVDDCALRTKPVTKAVKRDIPRSDDLVKKADANLVTSEQAAPDQKGPLLIDGIQEYGAALDRDPYNAEATLKLALAYDKVLRRGCALALLDRLGKLAGHPTYERAATERIDDVENHKAWFGGYRKDALKAVGRP